MNRFFLVCALFGLCVVGCSKTSNSSTQNSNQTTAAVSPSATATPAAQPTKTTEEKTDTNNDVTGAYFPSTALPADFSEIEHLSLANIDDQGKPAPLNGFIRPKRQSAKDYKLVNPKLDGKNLTFSTVSVDGVSYSFTGAFEKLDNFPENPPPDDEVVLKGTLTKMRDGKAVAETKVNFTYSAGD